MQTTATDRGPIDIGGNAGGVNPSVGAVQKDLGWELPAALFIVCADGRRRAKGWG